MTGDELPEDDHAARYVGGGRVDQNGRVVGNAFIGSADNPWPSCRWLEAFGRAETRQIAEVRRRSRLRPGATAVFARLHIGTTKAFVSNEAGQILSFVHMPLEAVGDYLEDPSHSVIKGAPVEDDPAAEFVGDLISQTIVATFPARPPKA